MSRGRLCISTGCEPVLTGDGIWCCRNSPLHHSTVRPSGRLPIPRVDVGSISLSCLSGFPTAVPTCIFQRRWRYQFTVLACPSRVLLRDRARYIVLATEVFRHPFRGRAILVPTGQCWVVWLRGCVIMRHSHKDYDMHDCSRHIY